MSADDRSQDERPDISDLEENPPEKLEDWPSDERKYETIGGQEGTAGYEESPAAKLGPSGLRHHEDGSVTIDGEKVDNPEEYKGEPIPGGPTDPNSPDIPGEKKKAGEDRDDESKDD